MNSVLLLIFIGAYFLGSIPFALICSRLFGLPDPRSYGSGNPGATNVLRTGRKAAAALTLAGDAAKAFAAVLIAAAIEASPSAIAVAAVAAVGGHVFSVFLRFRGGKGVSAALGALLAIDARIGLGALGAWLLIVFVTRTSSLGALVAAVTAPVLTAILLGAEPRTFAVLIISALILWRHKSNIESLLAGKERAFREG